MPWSAVQYRFRRAAKGKGHFDVIFRTVDLAGNQEIVFQAVNADDLEELAQALRNRAGQVSHSEARLVPFEGAKAGP